MCLPGCDWATAIATVDYDTAKNLLSLTLDVGLARPLQVRSDGPAESLTISEIRKDFPPITPTHAARRDVQLPSFAATRDGRSERGVGATFFADGAEMCPHTPIGSVQYRAQVDRA
jgi:hypothetical protein